MSRRRRSFSELMDSEIQAIGFLIITIILLAIGLLYLVWGIVFSLSGYILTGAVGLTASWVTFRCYRNERKEVGE
jgi:hypothetical protein